MRTSRLFIFSLVLVGLVAAMAFIARADPTGPGNLQQTSSSRANLTQSIKSAAAEAGNVTELSISADTITKAWQGYFGNISGQIVLADSLGNNFYAWNSSQPTGQVFASRNNSVQWATINCTNTTGMDAENTFLGKYPVEADSVNNTFKFTNHPSIVIGSRTLSGCWATQAYGGAGAAQGADFWNVLLSDNDGAGNTVYTTMINKTTIGFRNSVTDFELLVGENGNATSQAPTTYYFYVELD